MGDFTPTGYGFCSFLTNVTDYDERDFALFWNFTSLIFFPSKVSVIECLDSQGFVCECESISGMYNIHDWELGEVLVVSRWEN